MKGQIQARREQIAQRLGVPLEQALRESQADPDDRLAAAEQQLAAAQAALHHGSIDAAQTAAEALHSEVETGQQIVDYSLEVLGQLRSGTPRNTPPTHDRPVGTAAVVELVQRTDEAFADSALRLQASDPAYPDPDATLASRLGDAQADLNSSWQLLDQAEQAFREGKLLEADGRVQVARGNIEHADQGLADIRAHVDRLQAKMRENAAAVAGLNQRTRQLEPQLSDPRTTRPTLHEYDQLLQLIEQTGREVVEARVARDPFHNADRLQDLANHLSKIEGLLAADREAHAEAARALNGAINQLATANALCGASPTRRDPGQCGNRTLCARNQATGTESQCGCETGWISPTKTGKRSTMRQLA